MKNSSDIEGTKIELINWLTNISDKEVLDKVLAIKIKDKAFQLSAQQEAELDLRLAKYLNGEMKFKSWEETKESIRKRAKNAV